jgi:lipoprotein-anchoring transpeptidase ErfK/SrfK
MASVAQAENLSGNTPSSYFQNNPEAIEAFIQHVDNQADLSDEEKSAYKALVSPSKMAAGDDVLEMIDAETLKWFYGSEDQATENSEGLLHKVSKQSTGTSIDSCKQWTLCVYVSKSKQRLYAFYNGNPINSLYDKKVSTARPGKWTPTGTFSIGEIAGRWRVSNLYSGAALYYAMQIDGNIFIHATSEGNYKNLGRPASAGCVRTHLSTAEELNGLMRQVGRSNIRVVVE